MPKDERLDAYRRAAEEMAKGNFDVEFPRVNDDTEVAKLGVALGELGTSLEARFEEMRALARMTHRINTGLLLDEVLDYVFETFRPIIPYDRIGFSLLQGSDTNTVVRAFWARADYPDLLLSKGYTAKLAGSSLEQILDTREPRILNDLAEYLEKKPGSDSTRLIVQEGVRSSLTCPLISQGKPVGFMFFSSREPNTYADAHVGFFLEIAGQLSTIVEKSRLYEQLVDLNATQNRFLGMAAHDLRSPITVVKGYTTLYQAGILGPTTDEQTVVLSAIDSACEKMLLLIDDLLDVAAIENGQLRLERSMEHIETLLATKQAEATLQGKPKNIAVELDVEENLPEVHIDAARIGQVLDNLLSNAIKFSAVGTVIRITAAAATGDSVVVTVQDHGPGIPATEVPRLFADFAKGSARPTGGEGSTGLGLAIAKRLVVAHDGEIHAESEVGQGSVFSFSLPAVPALP